MCVRVCVCVKLGMLCICERVCMCMHILCVNIDSVINKHDLDALKKVHVSHYTHTHTDSQIHTHMLALIHKHTDHTHTHKHTYTHLTISFNPLASFGPSDVIDDALVSRGCLGLDDNFLLLPGSGDKSTGTSSNRFVVLLLRP